MSSPYTSASPNAAPKSSGKKWVLFGCGGCLGLITLALLGIAGFVFVVLGAIKKTDAYQIALDRTTGSPAVQEALGTPIKETFFSPMGAVNITGTTSTADLALTLQGPNGVASTVAKATKEGEGTWDFSILTVTIANTGQIIDLLADEAPAEAPVEAPVEAPADPAAPAN